MRIVLTIAALMILALSSLGASAEGMALPVTRELLNRLTLPVAEQLWQQKNREVQLARDRVAEVESDKLSAAQRPNAQLSLNTTAIGTSRDHSYMNGADSVLRIDQTIERGGKRDLRMRGAEFRSGAAHQDLADTLRQGHIALQQAYYDLMLAQEKLRIAEDNAQLFARTVEAARIRLNAGDISRSELSRIQVDALRAENDVRQARNDQQQAQAGLAYQLGAEADALELHATDSWPALQALPAAESGSIEQRADVRSAMLRVKAAEAARDLAMSLKTRDVTVGMQLEHNAMDRQSDTVGFGISIPLMTGYEYQGEIGRAEAELFSAQDDLERVRAQARTDITKARSDLEAAAERVQRFDSSLLGEASHALESSEFAYTHGAISVMDLLDARRIYKATQMDAVTARADYAKALAAWRYAVAEATEKEDRK